jgi:hypothetical protein
VICCGGIIGLGVFGLKAASEQTSAALPIVNARLDEVSTVAAVKKLVAEIQTIKVAGKVKGTCVGIFKETQKLSQTKDTSLGNFSSNSNNGKNSIKAMHFREYEVDYAELRISVFTIKESSDWRIDEIEVECDPEPIPDLGSIMK